MFIVKSNFHLNTTEEIGATIRLSAHEEPLIVNNVKIHPGRMIFRDAYDGKRFNQVLTIINCGKNSVTIRIFPPTAKAFKMKPLPTSNILSAGLSIKRHIRFTYTPTSVPQACMDIFVNNECIRYELLVHTSYPQITAFPKLLDFGEIDVGLVSEVKTITLTNQGTKQAHYATDLGRNELEIVVEPLKGSIQPGESKEMTVEVFGTRAGEFQQEFWIKSEPLQRIQIQGCFIQPRLKIDYPIADRSQLILNFSKTYVGVRRQRSVVILNQSSTSAVFCVNGRTIHEKVPYAKAKELDLNFKQFNIFPLEGRLNRDQKYVMRVEFRPEKPMNNSQYYMCHVIVDVKKCRADGNTCLQEKGPSPEIQTPQTGQMGPLLETFSVTAVEVERNDEDAFVQHILIFDEIVNILCYGEVELPEIDLKPNKLILSNIAVSNVHTELIEIRNKSRILPLILKYNKAPCIEFQPNVLTLPPSKTVSATLKLRPSKMGKVLTKIVFDIFYQEERDMIKVKTLNFEVSYSGLYGESNKLVRMRKPSFLPGITPTNHHEVGYLVNDVRFNTDIEKPIQTIIDKKLLAFDKNNDALMAVPNDRPRTLRPWKNPVPCKTIFSQMPRLVTPFDVDYDLTSSQQLLKYRNKSYYKDYIRSMTKKSNRTISDFDDADYETTNRKRLLLEYIKMNPECHSLLEKKDIAQYVFVPLTPYEIHNINLTPKFIQLGSLAAHSKCDDQFMLENNNKFPIHISIVSRFTSIKIKQDEFILGPESQKYINFTYHSERSGTHHMPMFIIMNFFHVFDVTVIANIVSNSVKCINKPICIVPTERTTFLELKNPLNSDVGFQVDTTFFHLEAFPSEGVIPANRNMIVTITYNPKIGFTPVKEITIVSESGAKELVEVEFDHKKANIAISTETLNFKDIPLNTPVTKELVIINKSDQLVAIHVELEDADLIPELTITPNRTLIRQKGDVIIYFTAHFKQVVNFFVTVNLLYQEHSRPLTIQGNVVYPNVTFKPSLIKIPKIPSGSTVKTPFRVYNNSEVTNYLLFPMEDYPEFTLRTKSGEDLSEGLSLSANEKRDLLLEYKPHEPVAYCIYLPYTLNGLIGPPELNNHETLYTTHYLENVKNRYKTPISVSQSSEKLGTMKVLCAANKKLLEYNTLQMEFCSFGITSHSFEVTNVSGDLLEVFMKVPATENLKITPITDNILIKQDTMNALLNVNDNFELLVEFTPLAYGKLQYTMPLFIKEYSEEEAFNYLKVIGVNYSPTIICKDTAIYFSPTHGGTRQSKTISLDLIGHRCDMKLRAYIASSDIEVIFVSQETVSKLKSVADYMVTFAPSDDCRIETEVTFSCDCQGTTDIEIYACSDSSVIINFLSSAPIINQSTYPLFPLETDNSNYAELMRGVLTMIEGWLYTQGYFCQKYCRVPEDIATYREEMVDKKQTTFGKKEVPQLPLVQLLINLIDDSILKYIDNGLHPSPEFRKMVVYKYVTYRNTISFLKSQGIQVPGLKPEYLLHYTEYVEFHKSFPEKESPRQNKELSHEIFYRFSKQMWLDFFFHIYKVLVMERVINPKPNAKAHRSGSQDNESNEFINTDKHECEKYFQNNMDRFPNWYTGDVKLLLWLEYHYNVQKTILWPNEKFENMHHLNEFADVDDSVSLATVTAAYCPYLRDVLKDIYPFPQNIEQKVHNACKVIRCWKSLKLSFDVHPQIMVSTSKIKIIFIVTYLYEVLPHFYPIHDVTIHSPLSESVSYDLSVQNCGNVPIQYTAIFFGECSELFKLDCSSVSVPGGKSKTLKLIYNAKRVLDASAILVLSGEVGGQRYAKSMAIAITGVPNTTMSNAIKFEVETYNVSKKKFELKSPYSKSYIANIFLCYDVPKSYADLHPFSSIRRYHIPREVDLAKNECEFNEKGIGIINMTTLFLSEGTTSFYLYFCNRDAGDFCIHLSIHSVFPKKKADDVQILCPLNMKLPCACRKGFSTICPRAFTVNIPSRNHNLWESAEKMVQRCFSRSTCEIVQKFFGTPTMFRLLKFYLERFPQGFMLPASIFDDQADFQVIPQKSFSCPRDSLKIDDVSSELAVPLVLHWNENNRPVETFLQLRSKNMREVRYYKLKFPEFHSSPSCQRKIQSTPNVTQ